MPITPTHCSTLNKWMAWFTLQYRSNNPGTALLPESGTKSRLLKDFKMAVLDNECGYYLGPKRMNETLMWCHVSWQSQIAMPVHIRDIGSLWNVRNWTGCDFERQFERLLMWLTTGFVFSTLECQTSCAFYNFPQKHTLQMSAWKFHLKWPTFT